MVVPNKKETGKASKKRDKMRRVGPGRSWRPTRTKIVATLGPASWKPSKIKQLIRAGVDVFRLNFSHGTHEEHGRCIRDIRRLARLEGIPIAVLADLQGPKIRVGPLEKSEPIYLKRKDELQIECRKGLIGKPGKISCTYLDLYKDVAKGDKLLLDDGALEVRVEGVKGKVIRTKVLYGGFLKEFKGINLPGTRLKAPCLTEKDLFDLDFALAQGVDYVALSFVRRPSDVLELRKRITDFGSDAQIISKIERPEAVKAFEKILAVSDAIMIARGDMGVELGAEAVPSIQKEIIRHCGEQAKPVITATQMLESMIVAPRPTRAEASDIANAILDGTSALMLSAETATGRNPVLAVKTMDRIARVTAQDYFTSPLGSGRRVTDLKRFRRGGGKTLSIEEGTVSAAAKAALEVEAKAILAFTETGKTARFISRERLPMRVLALTASERTFNRMALCWGVVPLRVPKARSLDQMYESGLQAARSRKHLKKGDRAVLIAGTIQISGATNTLTIREIGG